MKAGTESLVHHTPILPQPPAGCALTTKIDSFLTHLCSDLHTHNQEVERLLTPIRGTSIDTC